MRDYIYSVDLKDLPHIFIPSYRRPIFKSSELFQLFSKDLMNKVHIVVRSEEFDAYKSSNPRFDIIKIPEDYPIGGLASTRQFIFEYARDHHLDLIVDMDDDITGLHFCYRDPDKSNNQGRYTPKEWSIEVPDFTARLLTAGSLVMKEAIEDNDNVWIGSFRRGRWSQKPENHLTKYCIDKVTTCRQVTFVNVKGLSENNINRDMIFDRHGDDIGFVAVILANKGHCAILNSFIYSYLDEKRDSVIRNKSNERELHQIEFNALQMYPIKDYLRRTFEYEDGSYMWGDVDWRMYHKLMGTKSKSVPWILEEGIR